MRVLVVHPGPHFSVGDVHRGWVKGLRANGCQVLDFNLNDRLDFYDKVYMPVGDTYEKPLVLEQALQLANEGILNCCYRFWPDVVIVVSGFYVLPELFPIIRARRHRLVMLHTESPYEDQRQIGLAEQVDLNVINDPTNIEAFPAGTLFMPHAYDPDVHHPGPSDVKCDFSFVGTGYPSRREFFEAVDWDGIDALFGGNWQDLPPDSPLHGFVGHDLAECMDNATTADVYRGSAASANLYRTEAQRPDLSHGWAMGPREVELAACGTFYLTEARGENRDVLPMVPTFDSPEDFGDKLRWWLAHPDNRAQVAREAREAIADRTFANHAARLLQHLT